MKRGLCGFFALLLITSLVPLGCLADFSSYNFLLTGSTNGPIYYDNGARLRVLSADTAKINGRIYTYIGSNAASSSGTPPNAGGLAVYDMTDPANMQRIQEVPTLTSTEYVKVKDQKLYYMVSGAVRVYQINNDGTVETGSPIATMNSSFDSFKLVDNILIGHINNSGLRMFDTNNPSQPLLNLSENKPCRGYAIIKATEGVYRVAYFINSGVNVSIETPTLKVFDVDVTGGTASATEVFSGVPEGEGWPSVGVYANEQRSYFHDKTTDFLNVDSVIAYTVGPSGTGADAVTSRAIVVAIGQNNTAEIKGVTTGIPPGNTQARNLILKISETELIYFDSSGTISASYHLINDGKITPHSLNIPMGDRTCAATIVDNQIYAAPDIQGLKIIQMYDKYKLDSIKFDASVKEGKNTARAVVSSNISGPLNIAMVTLAIQNNRLIDFSVTSIETEDYEHGKEVLGSVTIPKGTGYTLKTFLVNNFRDMNILSTIIEATN